MASDLLSSRRMKREPTINRQRGFTIIELLIVVAIIGIIAVLAIPNLITAIQRSRQSRSVADIRMISEGIEAYQTDHSSYPVVDNGTVSELVEHLEIYIRRFNHLDGWGEPVLYDSDGSSYTVISFGGNKASNLPYVVGITSTFDADIVFADGNFFQWPEGPQTN
jgi:general secretion pathway protein G